MDEPFWLPCDEAEWWRRRAGALGAPADVGARVAELLDALRAGGDALARLEGALRRDPAVPVVQARLAPALPRAALEVASADLASAPERIAPDLRLALETARARLRAFLAPGLPRPYTVTDPSGNRAAIRVEPLARVGLFAPGGRAAYCSSVLMAAVPARLAGVGEIVLCTPAGPDGTPDPAVCAAAAIAGVDRVFLLGAVPAVAAMAFGLDPVPACDKIAGPGGPWLVEAKRQLFGHVGLDGLPGPSEIVVIASDGANPEWVAADLLAQAEHGPDGLALLITDSTELAAAIGGALAAQLERLATPRGRDACDTLRASCGPVVVPDLDQALALAAAIAPEHLALQGQAAEGRADDVRRAGAVLVGPWAPVAGGDYAAGTDHILPTAGAARYRSALGCADFVRQVQVFTGTAEGAPVWVPAARRLAEEEGFPAHAASLALRAAAARSAPPRPAAEPYVPPVPPGAIRVDLNENPYPWAEDLWAEVLEGVRAAEPWRYPRGGERLQAALAAYAGVPVDHVLPGNGSDELLLGLVTAWGPKVARVLYPTPTFGMYRRLAEAAGIPAVGVPLSPAPEFSLPLEALTREIGRGGDTLLFLCRPNNPTGNRWPADQVRQLVEREGVWAVIDEAYVEFADGGLTAWLTDHPRLVLLRTLSKAFALAGLRVGYALGRPDTLAGLRQAVQPWAVSAFSCVAAERALERRPQMAAQVQRIVAERERLITGLAQIPGITPYPSEANYVLFRVDPGQTGWRAFDLFDRLYAGGAVLRRWRGEPALVDCLRTSVGTPQENDRLLDAIRQAVQARM